MPEIVRPEEFQKARDVNEYQNTQVKDWDVIKDMVRNLQPTQALKFVKGEDYSEVLDDKDGTVTATIRFQSALIQHIRRSTGIRLTTTRVKDEAVYAKLKR